MEPRLYILMVDDDYADLALFGMPVDKTDLDIWLQTLSTGQQAIDYLEAKRVCSDPAVHPLPDVVVLDLKMPLLSGFDFLSWRKASLLFSSIPGRWPESRLLAQRQCETGTRIAVPVGRGRCGIAARDFWPCVSRRGAACRS